ncbi:MAG: hypothetical protein ABSH26_14750 [Opitutaceae bacterium]|jgi:hypothetical protein
MKMSLKHAAALLPLFAACCATAANDAGSSSAPQMPVASVQVVTTEDSSGYATWVAMANEKFKAAGGPDHFTHVYQGVFAGEETGAVFAVRFADSAVALAKDSEAIMKLPERHELMEHLGAIRKLGPSILLQAVHFEGTYDGEWVLVTDAMVKDEAAYIKALGELRALFDSHGLKDIKINAYRVVAGRSNHSHEVVICAPSEERSAAMIDSESSPWMTDWLAGVAGVRTVVHNGIYREISK